jgi:hypothetical protein
MDDGWVCGSCHSINRPGSGRCYSCNQSRATAEDPTVAVPVLDQNGGAETGAAMTMTCPACGTPRVGWSSRCRACGLSFDELAVAQVVEAASRGGGPLAKLLLRRLPVLIPGLLLLVVLLVVVTLVPSLRPHGTAAGPPAGQIWFGSSYSAQTYELAERRTSVRAGEGIALVARLTRHVAAGEVQFTAYRDGALIANQALGATSGSGEVLAGTLAPLQVPGLYALTISDTAGSPLANGTLTVTP